MSATATAVVNAYVRPIVQRYVDSLSSSLKRFDIRAPLLIMQSNGGVMKAEACARQPVFMIESGPAAGVIGSQELTQQANIPQAPSRLTWGERPPKPPLSKMGF